MKKYIAAICLLFLSLFSIQAKEFEKAFNDSTLRIDMIVGANDMQPQVMFKKASKWAKWAGRRNRLADFPYRGNGRLTATDPATGDTLYMTGFSTLFNEWFTTGDAAGKSKSFEHVVVMPLPKNETDINIDFFNNRGQVITSTTYRYSPADILVADLTAPSKYEVRYLWGGKEKVDSAIDVVILAEGYTADEMATFFKHAENTRDALLSYEPFASYADRFNIVAIGTISDDSGVTVPLEKKWRDTAIGSHFSTFYSDRYLTTPNVFDLYDALRGIDYEHLIVLANTTTYGGGGIFNNYTLTTALHENFKPVVVHEFGHSFGGLADEYFYIGDVMDDTYPTDVEPWEPNVTSLVDFNGKWENLLPEGCPIPTPAVDSLQVGVYEGAAYSFKGLYRPMLDCRMKTNAAKTFCPACQQALARLIHFYTDPEATKED